MSPRSISIALVSGKSPQCWIGHRQQGATREIIEDIIERTDGIPLFVEEMTKAVVEARVERRRGSS